MHIYNICQYIILAKCNNVSPTMTSRPHDDLASTPLAAPIPWQSHQAECALSWTWPICCNSNGDLTWTWHHLTIKNGDEQMMNIWHSLTLSENSKMNPQISQLPTHHLLVKTRNTHPKEPVSIALNNLDQVACNVFGSQSTPHLSSPMTLACAAAQPVLV